jgi:hypothetical protein
MASKEPRMSNKQGSVNQTKHITLMIPHKIETVRRLDWQS